MHSQRPTRFRAISARKTRTVALALTACLSLVALAACADTLRPLGQNPASAAQHANDLFEAHAVRFAPSVFATRFDRARVKLAETALIPSRVFDDTSVWDAHVIAASPTRRILYAAGDGERNERGEPIRYHIDSRPAPVPVVHVGDTRHIVELEKLPNSSYRWGTRVDLAAGTVTADDIGLLFTNLLRSPQGRTEKEVREDYSMAFPRARAAWGHGFTVDSLRTAPGGLGSTSVALTGSFRPELMRDHYPKLAAYLDKYLGPAKYHFRVTDRSGIGLFDITGQNRQMTIRYRLDQAGRVTTLAGLPRPWPDTLVLRSDVSLKVKVFTVGYRDLVSTFVLSKGPHERSATVIAQKEPDWDLPLLTERLLRSPLRRPFEGAGAMFSMAVYDSAGKQTLLVRRARLEVQESAIMRFLGGLMARLVGDLDEEVEKEEDRFLHDGFVALQGDLRALAGRWR